MNKVVQKISRLNGIQGLRGLAVLMVFSVHLYEVERKYSHGPLLFDRWIHASNFGVDLFLVISGFVLTYLAFGHFSSAAYARSYGFNRVTRVYPVYLLYTLPLVPVYLARPELFNATAGHEVNLLRSLLLLPDVNLPLIPVAWTLHHELYFYVLFGGMLFLPERRLPLAIAAFALLTVILSYAGWLIARPQQGAFQKVLFNPINFEFVFGMVIAWLVYKGERRGGALCLTLGFAGWFCGYLGFFHTTGLDWVDPYTGVILYAVPATFITYGVVVLELQRGWVFARSLRWVGDAAYSIYLTHVMALVVIGRLWHSIGAPGWAWHVFFLVGATALGLAVGNLAYRLIEKPLLSKMRHYDPARRPAVVSATPP